MDDWGDGEDDWADFTSAPPPTSDVIDTATTTNIVVEAEIQETITTTITDDFEEFIQAGSANDTSNNNSSQIKLQLEEDIFSTMDSISNPTNSNTIVTITENNSNTNDENSVPEVLLNPPSLSIPTIAPPEPVNDIFDFFDSIPVAPLASSTNITLTTNAQVTIADSTAWLEDIPTSTNPIDCDIVRSDSILTTLVTATESFPVTLTRTNAIHTSDTDHHLLTAASLPDTTDTTITDMERDIVRTDSILHTLDTTPDTGIITTNELMDERENIIRSDSILHTLATPQDPLQIVMVDTTSNMSVTMTSPPALPAVAAEVEEMGSSEDSNDLTHYDIVPIAVVPSSLTNTTYHQYQHQQTPLISPVDLPVLPEDIPQPVVILEEEEDSDVILTDTITTVMIVDTDILLPTSHPVAAEGADEEGLSVPPQRIMPITISKSSIDVEDDFAVPVTEDDDELSIEPIVIDTPSNHHPRNKKVYFGEHHHHHEEDGGIPLVGEPETEEIVVDTSTVFTEDELWDVEAEEEQELATIADHHHHDLHHHEEPPSTYPFAEVRMEPCPPLEGSSFAPATTTATTTVMKDDPFDFLLQPTATETTSIVSNDKVVDDVQVTTSFEAPPQLSVESNSTIMSEEEVSNDVVVAIGSGTEDAVVETVEGGDEWEDQFATAVEVSVTAPVVPMESLANETIPNEPSSVVFEEEFVAAEQPQTQEQQAEEQAEVLTNAAIQVEPTILPEVDVNMLNTTAPEEDPFGELEEAPVTIPLADSPANIISRSPVVAATVSSLEESAVIEDENNVFETTTTEQSQQDGGDDEWDTFESAPNSNKTTEPSVSTSEPPSTTVSTNLMDEFSFVETTTPPAQQPIEEEDLLAPSNNPAVVEPITESSTALEFGAEEEEDEDWDTFAAAPSITAPSLAAVAMTSSESTIPSTNLVEQLVTEAAQHVEQEVAANNITANEFDDIAAEEEEEWDAFESSTPTTAVEENTTAPLHVVSIDKVKEKEEVFFAVEANKPVEEEEDEWDAFEEAPSFLPVPVAVVEVPANVEPIQATAIEPAATPVVPSTVNEDAFNDNEDDDWDAFESAPATTSSAPPAVAVASSKVPEQDAFVSAFEEDTANNADDDDWGTFDSGTTQSTTAAPAATVVDTTIPAPVSTTDNVPSVSSVPSSIALAPAVAPVATIKFDSTIDQNNDIWSMKELLGDQVDNQLIAQWSFLFTESASIFQVTDQPAFTFDSPISVTDNHFHLDSNDYHKAIAETYGRGYRTYEDGLASWVKLSMETLLLPMIPPDAMSVEDVMSVSPGIDQYMAASLDGIGRSQSVALEERGMSPMKSSSVRLTKDPSDRNGGGGTPASHHDEGVVDDEEFTDFVGDETKQIQPPQPKQSVVNNNNNPPAKDNDNNPMLAYLNQEELSPIAYNFLKSLPDLSYVLIPH